MMGIKYPAGGEKQSHIAGQETTGIVQKPCQFWFWLHINNRFFGYGKYAVTRLQG